MRRTTGLGLLLAALAATSSAHGEPTQATPKGARIRLEPIRTTWCVGDNVSVRYVVENVGDEPFEVTATPPGFDDWWVLQVFDASGHQVGLPRSGPIARSWPMVRRDVTVARPFVRVVSLGRYGVLDRPGRYRVRLFHSLRWKGPGGKDYSGPARELPPDEDPRWTETAIELLEPTPERVESVLQVLEDHLNERYPSRDGDGVVPDPKLLRHPAYLEPLLARLRQAPRPTRFPEAWARGIASIPTVEATSALVDLVTTQELVRRPGQHPRELCAAALAERAPPLQGIRLVASPRAQIHAHEVALPEGSREAAWSASLAPRVRAWARTQLDAYERGHLSSFDPVLRHALRLLVTVGSTEEAEKVRALLRGDDFKPNAREPRHDAPR